ncbi:interleukin-26 [Amia ocellicauda]|uniref:interleukin-26 n=1 Tax=Amia ocellicauda TaxID=2972642 RepID=UPI003464AEDA
MKALSAAAALLLLMLQQLSGPCGAKERGLGARECLQKHVPRSMLTELFEMSGRLKSSVPRDEIKHKKLLPKFGKSVKKSKGSSVLKELLDFYIKDVFKKAQVDIADKNIFNYLTRLKKDFEHCLSLYPSTVSSKDRRMIKRMKETFIELDIQGVYKAIGELETVVDWVSTYMHPEKKKKQKETVSQK